MLGSFYGNAQVFRPNNIPGLCLWIDAVNPLGDGTQLADNSSLSTWYDKSNNTNSYSGFVNPTYKLNQINGLPSILFDGSSTIMFANSNFFPFADSTFAFFAVITTNTLAQSYFLSYGFSDVDQRMSFGIFSPDAGSDYYLNYEFDGAGDTGNTQLSINTPYVYLVSASSGQTSDQWTARIAATNQTLSGDAVVFNLNQVQNFLGCTLDQANFWGGLVAEIVFYSVTLTSQQASLVREYLGHKWGITP